MTVILQRLKLKIFREGGFTGGRLNRGSLFLVMGFVIGIVRSTSLPLTYVLYCSSPIASTFSNVSLMDCFSGIQSQRDLRFRLETDFLVLQSLMSKTSHPYGILPVPLGVVHGVGF